MTRPSKPGSENRRFIAYSVRSPTCSEWRATRICLQYVSVRFAPQAVARSGRADAHLPVMVPVQASAEPQRAIGADSWSLSPRS
jgi:hypothetical protein